MIGDRRLYAPAIQEVVRQGMLVRLAATIDAIDPPSSVGRPRVWPTLAMLQALWHLARDGLYLAAPAGHVPAAYDGLEPAASLAGTGGA